MQLGHKKKKVRTKGIEMQRKEGMRIGEKNEEKRKERFKEQMTTKGSRTQEKKERFLEQEKDGHKGKTDLMFGLSASKSIRKK